MHSVCDSSALLRLWKPSQKVVTTEHDSYGIAPYNRFTLCKTCRQPNMTAKKTIGDPIDVLLADSNQMQLQLLTGALRRRPEFNVTACSLDRRIHISYPQVPKILVLEALDRELVVNAFRSGA